VLCDIRYPYLDRDLLEFACAIPLEQMVGVGKRRFLMKRALAGIVPDEVLNRKRKAAVTQKPERYISTLLPSMAEMGSHIVSGSLGLVDSGLFLEALQRAHRNEEIAVMDLGRTVFLEFWLRHLVSLGLLKIKPTPRDAAGPLWTLNDVESRFSPKSSVS